MAPAGEIYGTTTEYARAEREGVGRRTVIGQAKERVETTELAGLLCGPGNMRRTGPRWTARCPLPDHEDRTPSFTVYTETNSWFCYGCLRGGDVIELARFAWGYAKREAPMTAAALLLQFGHPIPTRPAAWHRKRARQQPVRDALDEVRIQSLRRRLFRAYCGAWLSTIQDPREREIEAEAMWEALAPLTRRLYFEGRAQR